MTCHKKSYAFLCVSICSYNVLGTKPAYLFTQNLIFLFLFSLYLAFFASCLGLPVSFSVSLAYHHSTTTASSPSKPTLLNPTRNNKHIFRCCCCRISITSKQNLLPKETHSDERKTERQTESQGKSTLNGEYARNPVTTMLPLPPLFKNTRKNRLQY